jgi:hypothetical protein
MPRNFIKLNADQTSISVSWSIPESDGSTAITSYNLYWDNATGTIINVPIGSTSWQTRSFSISGLTTNKYYRFAVAAVNIVGEGAQVNTAPIITAKVPG